MFILQLFTKNYGKHEAERAVDSLVIPRPGDPIDVIELAEDGYGGRFVVFDVSHILAGTSMQTVVRARTAARKDRLYVLSENGHISGPNPLDCGYFGDEG